MSAARRMQIADSAYITLTPVSPVEAKLGAGWDVMNTRASNDNHVQSGLLSVVSFVECSSSSHVLLLCLVDAAVSSQLDLCFSSTCTLFSSSNPRLRIRGPGQAGGATGCFDTRGADGET